MAGNCPGVLIIRASSRMAWCRGPVFDELDTTLQQAFLDYLEERGVTAELAEYLLELVHDKLEVEYMSWLERMQNFITKRS